MSDEYRSDYPNEPIGGDNPYYCCSHCKISDPEINGRVEGHAPWCKWRIAEEEKGLVFINCLGVDDKLHVCRPHEDKTFCGVGIVRKKLLKDDFSMYYSCYECTY